MKTEFELEFKYTECYLASMNKIFLLQSFSKLYGVYYGFHLIIGNVDGVVGHVVIMTSSRHACVLFGAVTGC